MASKRLIQSMFLRRLWTLVILAAVLCAVLATQTWRLTVVEGADFLRIAESRLVSDEWTPTIRGRILDRKGRVLAQDEASFDILVDYRVITGESAYSRAAAQARRENRDAWPKLGRSERERLIKDLLRDHEIDLRTMWVDLSDALAIDLEEIERRKSDIRRDVQRTTMTVWERWLVLRREELNRDREVGADVSLSDVMRPLAVQREPHIIAKGVSEDIGYAVRRIADRYPGVRVEPSGRRTYPFESLDIAVDLSKMPAPLRVADGPPAIIHVEGVSTHIVGWMRGMQREDVQSRPAIDPATGEIDRGVYLEGDQVGANGIESKHERALRGLRGKRIIQRDTDSPAEVIDAQRGEDVSLTIDINLQARVHAIMDPALGLAKLQPWHRSTVESQAQAMEDGTPLYGAAVVLEIDTGEVLALVSTPTFLREQLQTDSAAIFGDPVSAAWVNKAIAKPYPPGSIVKPMILAAAATDRVYRLDEPVECTGHLYPNQPQRLRCWIFKQNNMTHTGMFGRGLLGEEAIAVSCNIFFYTLAQRIGIDKLIRWYKAFGVESVFDLGIGAEYAGSVGVVPRTERLSPGHAALLGIGQGPIAWTPLHAADMFATLARGGLRLVPRIVSTQTPQAHDIRLDPSAVDMAIKGLRGSTQPNGTGYSLRYVDDTREPIFYGHDRFDIVGKTGTADAPDLLGDSDDGGSRITLREGDHSWFVVMVGQKGGRPLYVISVVMEYAGSGGRVSGPIVNQIIKALDEEGYL